ncbi:hypothetical protein EBN03_00175 [Nocardia stercoris]|uniref:GNAT family N-acetyltransferase n=1 Tax=Nocardia stercoris TaxID=2483361 RepID=A0A3M2LB95_9NOCA|nr:hypothetical protein EBN03_00175 [Nocardia stercoris]
MHFRDALSGCTFRAATPETRPDLWLDYLEGAQDAYRHFGVEDALEYTRMWNGSSTSLFIVACDSDGRVVAGLRAIGAYEHHEQPHALEEWAGQPGEPELRRMIAGRIDSGVVEVKAVWVARDVPNRSALAAAISRCIVHAAWLLGARYALVTASDHAATRYRTTGAVPAAGIPAVPYPDARYRTIPLWWDTTTCRQTSDPAQGVLMAAEQTVMAAEVLPSGTEAWRVG